MDVPFAIHVDSSGLVESLPSDQARLEFQARSLRNTLLLLRRRLNELRKDRGHTLEDVEHYKVMRTKNVGRCQDVSPRSRPAILLQYVLDHLDQRWRDAGGFASALRATHPALAGACSRLWAQCSDLAAAMGREAQEMPAEVRAVHARLADLRCRLRAMAGREHGREAVAQLGAELDEVDAARRARGGGFGGDVEAPAPGQAVCGELLSQNYGEQGRCRGAGW